MVTLVMAKYYMGNKPVYSVSEITSIIDRELSSAFFDIWVEGESNDVKISKQGHIYFTIKDEKSALKVAFFKNYALKTPFKIENGMSLLIRGRISIYTKSGDLQLYAEYVEPSGIGAMQQAIEQAKRRLMEEGLTNPERKRSIPRFPKKIGVVTSLEGAVIKDFISILKRRNASVEILVSESSVQGEKAPEELIQSLKKLYSVKGIDVIVLMRGGGSMEDLMAFNNEQVARVVASSPVPLISAVGHEIDTVLTDLTADLRTPTPSSAAEILSEGYISVRKNFTYLLNKIISSIENILYIQKTRLSVFNRRTKSLLIKRKCEIAEEKFDKVYEKIFSFPSKLELIEERIVTERNILKFEKIIFLVTNFEDKIANISRLINIRIESKIKEAENFYIKMITFIEERNPMKILSKGYSILFDKNNRPVKEQNQVEIGDELPLKIFKGKLKIKIEGKE
jgi:exodeoxyribonuclease VII large subunit